MRGDRSGRLTILSETEKLALYGLPDFDDFQRIEFFANEGRVIRHREGVTQAMRVKYGSRQFEIPSVIDANERHAWLQLESHERFSG